MYQTNYKLIQKYKPNSHLIFWLLPQGSSVEFPNLGSVLITTYSRSFEWQGASDLGLYEAGSTFRPVRQRGRTLHFLQYPPGDGSSGAVSSIAVLCDCVTEWWCDDP